MALRGAIPPTSRRSLGRGFADAENWTALHALMGADEPAVLFTPEPVLPSGPLEIVMAATGEQMTGAPKD